MIPVPVDPRKRLERLVGEDPERRTLLALGVVADATGLWLADLIGLPGERPRRRPGTALALVAVAPEGPLDPDLTEALKRFPHLSFATLRAIASRLDVQVGSLFREIECPRGSVRYLSLVKPQASINYH